MASLTTHRMAHLAASLGTMANGLLFHCSQSARGPSCWPSTPSGPPNAEEDLTWPLQGAGEPVWAREGLVTRAEVTSNLASVTPPARGVNVGALSGRQSSQDEFGGPAQVTPLSREPVIYTKSLITTS